MAEVDPMVQAFLKARAKNIREEVKLQRYLTNLELRKANTKSTLDDQLFEHRQIAFELRKEADSHRSKEEFISSADATDSVFEDKTDKGRPRPPRTDSRVTFLNLDSVDKGNGTMVTILPQRGNETEGDLPVVFPNPADDGNGRPRLASAISFPPVWKTFGARLGDVNVEDISNEETAAKTGDCKQTKDRNKEEALDCWPGDPIAIGSVRRPRKSTKELNAREQSRVSLRTASRELRQFATCSRQCGKSQFIYELERSIADIPLLLPAIIAERERRAQFEDRLRRERTGSGTSLGGRSAALPGLVTPASPPRKRPLLSTASRELKQDKQDL